VCTGGGPRICPESQTCTGNTCVAIAEPFDCSDAAPGQAPFPTFDTVEGVPPPSAGGVLPDGVYVTTLVTAYGSFPELDQFENIIPASTIEFRGGFFNESQVTYGVFSGETALSLPVHSTGNYQTTGTSLTFDVVSCGQGAPTSQVSLGYSIVGDRLEIQRSGIRVRFIQTYTRQ
jgi:hypothetical protein